MYRAAAALIEQHHCYSKAALLEYLARNHPMVEPEQRLPLLIGAVTGAQAAARLHVFTLLNKDSTGDEGKKLTANASRALSYWNFGLREKMQPTMPLGCSTESIFSEGSLPERTRGVPSTTASASIGARMEGLALPVRFEQAIRDFPMEPPNLEEPEPLVVDLQAEVNQLMTSSPVVTTAQSATEVSVVPYVPPPVTSALRTTISRYDPTPITSLLTGNVWATSQVTAASAVTAVTWSAATAAPRMSTPTGPGVSSSSRAERRLSTTEQYRNRTVHRPSSRFPPRYSPGRRPPSSRREAERHVSLTREEYDRLLKGPHKK